MHWVRQREKLSVLFLIRKYNLDVCHKVRKNEYAYCPASQKISPHTVEALQHNKRLTVVDLSGNPDLPVVQQQALEAKVSANRAEESQNRRNERRERFSMNREEFAVRQYMMQVLCLFTPGCPCVTQTL